MDWRKNHDLFVNIIHCLFPSFKTKLFGEGRPKWGTSTKPFAIIIVTCQIGSMWIDTCTLRGNKILLQLD